MAAESIELNPAILRQCREQIGLNLEELEKKFPRIALFEKGEKQPTFKQLNDLAAMYRVPRWVFFAETLPDQYRFDSAVPVFRKFASSKTNLFSSPKIRSITAKVESLRELILDLREDSGETVPPFEAPILNKGMSPEDAATIVRKWLHIPEERLDFPQWKALVEEKGIFVFMTSRYKDWSHIDREMLRGMSIYHSTLPVIIINDADYNKAQAFTLMHELAHIIRRESSIDSWSYNSKEELWSDEFAGNILLPAEWFRSIVHEVHNLDSIKNISSKTNASIYACLVRCRQLGIINQHTYSRFEAQLHEQYAQNKKKLKESSGGPVRDRAQEILFQYGNMFTHTLFQAYYNKEIGLHKLSQLFGLKQSSYVLEMEHSL